ADVLTSHADGGSRWAKLISFRWFAPERLCQMNRQKYIDALLFCSKADASGAMAGETAMALRAELGERQKLHLFCCIEEANMARCLGALPGEGQESPPLGKSIHRAAHKIGSWLGEGDWQTFLDRFGATIHPQ